MVLGTSQACELHFFERILYNEAEKICRETDSSVYFIHGTTSIQGTEGKKKPWTEKKGGGLPITL